MKKTNYVIRDLLHDTGVRHWQLALSLGIDETTLCRRLRRQLSETETTHYLKLINQIASNEHEDC